MLVKIHPDNPAIRKIENIVKTLEAGGVIIYPTDTIYALGCDILNQKAIERISRIKGLKKGKSTFSFICSDLSHASEYGTPPEPRLRRRRPDRADASGPRRAAGSRLAPGASRCGETPRA